MKGAYLIAEAAEDLSRIAEIWRSRHATNLSQDVIQWREGEFLFNVFVSLSDYQSSDWREGWRDSVSTTSEPPDTAGAWWIECRSEELFARTLREGAAVAENPMWVLDSNDVLWPAEAIDPSRIVL